MFNCYEKQVYIKLASILQLQRMFCKQKEKRFKKICYENTVLKNKEMQFKIKNGKGELIE